MYDRKMDHNGETGMVRCIEMRREPWSTWGWLSFQAHSDGAEWGPSSGQCSDSPLNSTALLPAEVGEAAFWQIHASLRQKADDAPWIRLGTRQFFMEADSRSKQWRLLAARGSLCLTLSLEGLERSIFLHSACGCKKAVRVLTDKLGPWSQRSAWAHFSPFPACLCFPTTLSPLLRPSGLSLFF